MLYVHNQLITTENQEWSGMVGVKTIDALRDLGLMQYDIRDMSCVLSFNL